MGFRFRRSITLGKFFRVNLSKSGIGASVGVPGARITTGPRGHRLTLGLPGTGLSYQKDWGHSRKSSSNNLLGKAVKFGLAALGGGAATQLLGDQPDEASAETGTHPVLDAGTSRTEKEFVEGLALYSEGNPEGAIAHFLNAAPDEPGAALLAAALLSSAPEQREKATSMLEQLIEHDAEFPTPIMQKYIDPQQTMPVDITPNVTANVPIDSLLTTLLLVECYQAQNRLDEAIGLLEEVEALAGEPAVTLSLCELYLQCEAWDGIIERAASIESEDDSTLEIVILYARALQAKGLHDAALHVLTPALRRKKDRSDDLLREARYWRAISYREVGKTSQANKDLQTIYAEDPTFRDVAHLVGVA